MKVLTKSKFKLGLECPNKLYLRDDNSVFGKKLNIVYDNKSKKWYSEGLPKEIFACQQISLGPLVGMKDVLRR